MNTSLIENFITYLSQGLIDPDDGKERSLVEYCHKHRLDIGEIHHWLGEPALLKEVSRRSFAFTFVDRMYDIWNCLAQMAVDGDLDAIQIMLDVNDAMSKTSEGPNDTNPVQVTNDVNIVLDGAFLEALQRIISQGLLFGGPCKHQNN